MRLRRLLVPVDDSRYNPGVSPITHFLVSWAAVAPARFSVRDEALAVFAGVVPDIDGLGIVPEVLTRHSAHPLLWFTEYHHLLGHNLGFCIVVTSLAFVFARQKLQTAVLACICFHLHLFCDLVGARGPDGYQWPIPYLLPFSHRGVWTWSGQWALNAWPNVLITIAALVFAFAFAWYTGNSPLRLFSPKGNRDFVAVLRARIPRQQA